MAYLLLLPTLVLSIITRVSTQECYNSQGLYDPSLIACGGYGGCCKTGDTCYSNGLCKGQHDLTSNINYYYNGCTSQDWSALGCAPQCLNITTTKANGVQPCAGGSNGYNNYCCLGFDISCNCSDASILVSIPDGNVVTPLALSSSSIVSPSSTFSSSTTSTSQPTTSASTSTLTSSGTTSPATVDAVPHQSDQQNSWLSTGVIVGIAVAAASVTFAGMAAAWFLAKRQRQRRLQDDHNLHGPPKQSPPLGVQSVPRAEGYMKPELDSQVHHAFDVSPEDKVFYIPKMSELPSQNKAPAEVPA